MSTSEKLLFQTLERKDSIIDQVKQQIDLYYQQLASRSIIEGITPPSWLWNPGTESQNSDAKELKKEKLISEFLLPRPQTSIPYYTCYNSLYNKTADTVNKEVLAYDPITEPRVCSKGLERTTLLPLYHVNDSECALNSVPEMELNTSTPHDKTDARTLENYPNLEQSLARLQRSKSRQKALQLRNSAKAEAGSRLHDRNDSVLSSGGNAGLMMASLQSNYVNEVELVKPFDMTNEISKEKIESDQRKRSSNIDCGGTTRSRSVPQSDHMYQSSEPNSSSYIAKDEEVLLGSEKSLQQHNHYNLSSDLADPFDRDNESFGSGKVREDMSCKENGSNVYSGRVTRSRSSCLQLDSLDMSLKLSNSSDIVCIDRGTVQECQLHDRETIQYFRQNGGVTDFPTAQGTQTFAENSSPKQKSPKLFIVNKTRLASKENDVIENGSRWTRSRDSASINFQNKNDNHARKSSPSQTDIEFCTMITQSNHSTEGKSIPVNVNVPAQKKSHPCTASGVKLLDLFEADDIRKTSSIDIPVEACVVTSECEQEGDLSVELKKLTLCPQTYHSLPVNPKQLNFNDIEKCSLNAVFPPLERKEEKQTLEKQPSTVLEPVNFKNETSQSRTSILLDMEHSWPQYKRRKMENQLSAPPSLTVKVLKSIDRNPIDKYLNKEEDNSQAVLSSPWENDHSSEEKHSFETNSQFETEQLRLPCGSSLTKLETENSQVDLIETRSDYENAEKFTSLEQDIHENTSYLRDDNLLTNDLIGSLQNEYIDTIDDDQYMPVLERFSVEADNKETELFDCYTSFHEELLPKSTLERASILEKLCKSASMNTPLFPTTQKLHKTSLIYQSVPGPNSLEHEVNQASHMRSNSDGSKFPGCIFDWDIKNPYRSPNGKFWEITGSSSSSGKHRSSNPELTTITEDPNICEELGNIEEVNDTLQEDRGSTVIKSSTKRGPVAEITEDYEIKTFHGRDSLDSVSTEIYSVQTQNKDKQRPHNQFNNSIRVTNNEKENKNLSLNTKGVKSVSESYQDGFNKVKLSGKNSLRVETVPASDKRESKRNNIVSNITSFVPLVQQKQAAAVPTGKRDIKVKALEAAEAAKRLEERKENERKMKKEVLKLERARLEQENLKQLELKKKNKEAAQKKKDADMAVRKRAREEEGKKEKEVKRIRVEEVRRRQKEQEEKLLARQQLKEAEFRATALDSKKLKDGKGLHKKIEQEKGDSNLGRVQETKSTTIPPSTTYTREQSIVVSDVEALRDHGDFATNMDKEAKNDNLRTSEGYDISPYQCSDDEEVEEYDIPNTKVIPSWASNKNNMAMAVASQVQIDTDLIFPFESFPSIDEVLMPRRKQIK